MRILVAEKIADSGLNMLKEKVQVDIRTGLSREELLACICDYDALIVRSGTKVDKEVIQKGVNLKVIARAGIGVDNIDLNAATSNGVIVVNTPQSNNVSTAEHSVALLLAAARKIPQAYLSLKQEIWDRGSYNGVELYGKTVAILGMGRIGSIVASRLKAFGMKVLGYDPYITEERFEKLGVKKAFNIDDVMEQADFISIHLPKTEETIGIIGEEQLRKAKKSLIIVNCARGGMVDETALYNALKEERIAGAAVDVFCNEPKGGDKCIHNPLLDLDNIIATPHLGASTIEAQENVGTAIAEQVIKALNGEMVNAVNLPDLHGKDIKGVSQYMKLAEKMGKLYYQLEKEPVKKVVITYSGEVAQEETRLITLSYLIGLLEPVLKERVNIVNVEMIAKNRGIEVVESIVNKVSYFTNLVTVKVKNRQKEIMYAGTVFGKEELRMVNIAGYDVDFIPTPYMLVAENIDRPGIIGQVGTILGKCNINIETMNVSRNTRDIDSIMVLSIDSLVDNKTISMLKNIEGINKVNMVEL